MKQLFTLTVLLVVPLFLSAQQLEIKKKFAHFEESRGDASPQSIVTLPYEEMVVLRNALNSNSGLGPTFNYYGTIVVVDQMNVLPNGDMQLVLRREDGRDFYGFQPTLKAIVTKTTRDSITTANNN